MTLIYNEFNFDQRETWLNLVIIEDIEQISKEELIDKSVKTIKQVTDKYFTLLNEVIHRHL